ncbi:MAG: hypothetical protein PHR66_11945, partial [Desulfuromonadaceae bacterium]|nr:hypothetical protein [Desulfuromonadaceae bacterium]
CERNAMDLNSDQKKLVELFVRQEFLIGKLYKLFSFRFPAYKDFWTKMAAEEHLHASWIRRLTERDPTGKFRFSQGELRSGSLASSIKSIEGLIAGVKNDSEFTINQAASMALHLEKALWEQQIFRFFEGDSDEVRKILDSLNVEQKIHMTKMEKFAFNFI